MFTALIWSAKMLAFQPVQPATLNSCIRALKLYIYRYIDIYLKDNILALTLGARNQRKCNAVKIPVKLYFIDRIQEQRLKC